MPEDAEYKARLASLRRGPWWIEGDIARTALSPPSSIAQLAERAAPVNLQALAKGYAEADPAGSRNLQHLLRTHKIGQGITSPDESKVRDSLDYALAHLMVLELAVETGYLPLDLVQDEARREFSSLLWSDGAQQFVRYYDYVTIEYLARRLNVAGFRNVEPPAINPEAGTRFAVFLAQFSEWVEDKAIREWLRFLDDYAKPGEHQAFRLFLKGASTERSDRFDRLLYGIQRFLLSLSNLFGMLAPAERARFGLFYSYWMAKFFGYELEEDGYRQATQQSCADIVREHPEPLLPPTSNDKTRAALRELLIQQIATIREAWTVTSELVAASSASKR